MCIRDSSTAHFLDDTPGDRAHVLALDRDHGVGELPDDLLLLLRGEDALDELDVDERHAVLLTNGRGSGWNDFHATEKDGQDASVVPDTVEPAGGAGELGTTPVSYTH